MIIGSISENIEVEKRVALTPEIIKKYKSLGLEVYLNKDYASHIGINDKEYEAEGANILANSDDVISKSNAILQMNILSDENLNKLTKEQILIGVLNPYLNDKKLKAAISKNVNCFSLELLPRITRAQSMDILSSQANLAGYKAVVDSFSFFQKAIPMMMTAAGTISAAKVLVVGAEVWVYRLLRQQKEWALLFLLQTSEWPQEQVESLGGNFLTVEGSENLETDGGYAKEATDDFKKKQEELLKETLKKTDIVICTALIPGKKAPIIIKKNMIDVMTSGSVIYDLAASQGGNSELTEVDEIIESNGVKIMGEANILNRLPVSASNLFSKNIFNFVNNLYDNEKKSFNINLDDEIIEKTMVKL